MKKLVESKRKHIGLKAKELREILGLSYADIAEGSGISRNTVIAIEKGKSYSLDSLLYVSYFFGMELEIFVNLKTKFPSQERLREQIIAFHKDHSSEAHLVLNKSRLNIKNILKERLLKTSFLNSAREMREILEYCKEEYKIKLQAASLTNTLKQLAKDGLIKITVPTGNKNFLYKKTTRK